jgi:hypothetical protein
MAELLQSFVCKPIDTQENWEDIFTTFMSRGASLLQKDSAMCRLLLGPKTPMEIRRGERQNDRELAHNLIEMIGEQFNLPEIPNRPHVFFHAIEIFDLFLSLSVLEHGRVVDDAIEEAKRAAVAYLKLYIPSILPPLTRDESPPLATILRIASKEE